MVYLFWAYSYGRTNDRLRLYFKDFAAIQASVPPQDEQVRIGEILSLWDTAIAQMEKLIKAKRKLRTGIMQQLLAGKRRFPGFTESWKTVAIQDVCDVQIGGTPARKNAEYWAEPSTGHPWVSISDLNGKWITSTKEQITALATKKSNTKLVTKGTTLMSFKLTVGKAARAGIDLYTNEAIAAFYPKQNLVESDYLYLALPIAAGRTLTDQAVKGRTLNKKKINSMLLELPHIEEQREISKFVSVADSEIGILCSLSDQLKKQRYGLMQKLLTGQIRVKAAGEMTAC